ncbi:MAG TPA: hypothetical protein VMP68_02275 [Candidatus Eisenbacteria bacterium]|nr:hypothetical protein [Candidatus Eisenbacteria bacterium]
MSINPVPGTGPSEQAVFVSPAARAASSGATQSHTAAAPPDSGTQPKSETQTSHDPSAAREMSQDEVCVQRDSGLNGQIVIRYLDSEGNLILQIPSSQVLGLAKAIEQALEDGVQPAKPERSGSRPAEGGKS